MSSVLTVGTSGMELVMHLARIPAPGEKLRTPEGGISYVPGGDGANCAVALAKLGISSILCTRLGGDINGQRLHAMYRECGIDTSAIVADPHTPTGTSVIMVSEDGAAREVIFPGANDNLTRDNLEPAFSRRPDMLALQLSIPEDTLIGAANRARDLRIPTVLFSCPENRDFNFDKLPPVEIALFNEQETERLTGVSPNGEANALRAVLALSKLLSATYYVIKLGHRGAFLFDGVHRQMISPYIVKVVDPAGGGDAFLATVMREYLRNGSDITGACRRANAAAAITLLRAGVASAFPTDPEIDAFIARNGLK